METRERRRWLTDRAARHKQHIFLDAAWRSRFFLSTPPLLGKMRKGKSIGCSCRTRAHGRPKYGIGVCGGPRESWIERVRGNRFCRRFLKEVREGTQPDDVE